MIPTTTETVAAPAETGSWLAQTWRLTRWNLFTVRRRLMSKVLLVIAVLGFAVVVGFQILAYVAISNAPTQAQACSTATTQDSRQAAECAQLTPDQQAQLQQQQDQQRKTFVASLRSGVTFPASLGLAGGYISFMGVILLCVLAGSLIGGEYGSGTIRLALSRGVGRGQMVVAQVVALALLALGLALGLLLLGVLAGVIVGPSLGGIIPAIPGGGWVEFTLYWLAVALNLFAFELVAFFIATLGRSTAAGIAASLGYVLLESIVAGILVAIGQAVQGDLGGFLAHAPDWFLGPNAATIGVNVSQSPVDLGISTSSVAVQLTTAHALLVTFAYCVLLAGLGYLLVRQRDVTA
jgi:ABC-type transport system involved in multi-copper enzyme maturation permease subunit